jgi:hypothetical protein
MATITWPADLPQVFLTDSFGEGLADNVIVDKFDTGPATLRRRNTWAPRPVSGRMVMDADQWEELKAFCADVLIQRVLPFGFPVQGDCSSPVDEWLVRFKSAPKRSRRGEDWEVTLELEVLAVTVAEEEPEPEPEPEGALLLLEGEAEGFAIDATTEGGTVAVIDAGTPANNLSNANFASANIAQGSASPKTVRWNDGTMITHSAGVIPQAWDAVNSRFGILVEPAATNLVIKNEDYGDAAWTRTDLSEANTTAPDGSSTASTLTVGGAGGNILTNATLIAVANSTVYTASEYLKYVSGSGWVQIITWDGTGGGSRSWFDLQNGAVGSTATFGSAWTISATSIEDVGNGWYRCTTTFTSANTVYRHAISSVSADNTSTRDSAGAAYSVWRMQTELGIFATSPIATDTVAVTRAGDQITVDPATFPHSSTAGTMIIAVQPRAATANVVNDAKLAILSNSNLDERMFLSWVTGTPDAISASVVDGNVGQVSFTPVAATGSEQKAALAYELNNVGLVVDGGAEQTDTSATLPTPTQLDLGWGSDFANRHFNGFIYDFIYVPRRMTEAEMQTKTA